MIFIKMIFIKYKNHIVGSIHIIIKNSAPAGKFYQLFTKEKNNITIPPQMGRVYNIICKSICLDVRETLHV